MTESELLKRLMLAISNIGARVFRNHVGLTWQAGEYFTARFHTKVDLRPGDVVLRNARRVQAGLCVGSSDLVGWTPHEITPDDVGRVVPIFTAIEAKSERGRLSEEQRNFMRAVRASGGIAVEARTTENAIDDINEQRKGKP